MRVLQYLKLTFAFLFLCTYVSARQPARLSTKPVNVSYVQLPRKPIQEKTNRTFDVYTQMFTYQSAYSETEVCNSISIDQFKRVVKDSAYLHIKTEFAPFEVKGFTKKTKKKSVRTKEGKKYIDTYYYSIEYEITAKLMVYSDKGRRSDGTYNYGGKDRFDTDAFETIQALDNYYKMQSGNIQAKLKNAFIKKTIEEMKQQVNDDYGYQKKQEGANFYMLKKSKHKEYEGFEDAFNNVNRVFASMRYDEPTGYMEQELTDAIDYYKGIMKKYHKDDKRSSKVRFAAMHNLATLYYYFDNFSAAKQYAQMIINTNKNYGVSLANKLVNDINKAEGLVKINGVENRHIPLDQ